MSQGILYMFPATGNLLELQRVGTGSFSISTSVTRVGPYSYHCADDSSGVYIYGITQDPGHWNTTSFVSLFGAGTDIPYPSEWFNRFFFRFDALPTDKAGVCGTRGVQFNPGVGWLSLKSCRIALNSSGKLDLYDQNDTLVQSGTTVLSTNTWYMIDFSVLADDAAGTATLKINGSTEFGAVTGNYGVTANLGAGVYQYFITSFVVGSETSIGTSSSINLYFTDGCGRDDQFPIGSVTTINVPTANGNYANGSQNADGGGTPAATLWQSVNALPMYTTTTEILVNGDGTSPVTFATNTRASGNIDGCINLSMAYGYNGSDTLRPYLSGPSGDDHPATSTTFNTGASILSAKSYAVDPSTGMPWTVIGIDSAQPGVQQTGLNTMIVRNVALLTYTDRLSVYSYLGSGTLASSTNTAVDATWQGYGASGIVAMSGTTQIDTISGFPQQFGGPALHGLTSYLIDGGYPENMDGNTSINGAALVSYRSAILQAFATTDYFSTYDGAYLLVLPSTPAADLVVFGICAVVNSLYVTVATPVAFDASAHIIPLFQAGTQQAALQSSVHGVNRYTTTCLFYAWNAPAIRYVSTWLYAHGGQVISANGFSASYSGVYHAGDPLIGVAQGNSGDTLTVGPNTSDTTLDILLVDLPSLYFYPSAPASFVLEGTPDVIDGSPPFGAAYMDQSSYGQGTYITAVTPAVPTSGPFILASFMGINGPLYFYAEPVGGFGLSSQTDAHGLLGLIALSGGADVSAYWQMTTQEASGAIGLNGESTPAMDQSMVAEGRIGFNGITVPKFGGTIISRTQETSSIGNGNVASATWLQATTASNFLLCVLHAWDAGVVTPPDGWTLAISATSYSVTSYIYYSPNSSARSGPEIFQLGAASKGWWMAIAEYVGVSGFAPLDMTASNFGGGQSLDSGTTTVTSASELWVVGFHNFQRGAFADPDNFTMVDQGEYPSHHQGGYAELVTIAEGTANCTTTGGSGLSWIGMIATFFANTCVKSSGHISLGGEATCTPIVMSGPPNILSGSSSVVAYNVFDRVQEASASLASTSSITVTWTTATAPGNLLVAVVAATGSYNFLGTPSGWTVALSGYSPNGSVFIYYIASAGSQVGTQTFTAGASCNMWAAIAEYSGGATANVLDRTASNFGSGTVLTSGSTLTTSTLAELFIGGFISNTTTPLSSPTNGYSIVDQAIVSTMSSGYTEKIGIGLQTTSCGVTAGSAAWFAAVVTFAAGQLSDGNQVIFLEPDVTRSLAAGTPATRKTTDPKVFTHL